MCGVGDGDGWGRGRAESRRSDKGDKVDHDGRQTDRRKRNKAVSSLRSDQKTFPEMMGTMMETMMETIMATMTKTIMLTTMEMISGIIGINQTANRGNKGNLFENLVWSKVWCYLPDFSSNLSY